MVQIAIRGNLYLSTNWGLTKAIYIMVQMQTVNWKTELVTDKFNQGKEIKVKTPIFNSIEHSSN